MLDGKHRLFQRRDTPTPTRLSDFSTSIIGPGAQSGAASPRLKAPGEDWIDRSALSVVEQHFPAYLVINRQYEILRFSGSSAGRYLEPSTGVASLGLFSILRRALRPSVRSGVQKAFAERQSVVHENVAVNMEGSSRLVTVIVEPIDAGRAGPVMCVVAFRDHGNAPSRPAARVPKGAQAALQALEQELVSTKAQLQIAIDEAETASEEMKSSAEEYQSINEELQSTNEELETAKEEMQSINEELQTINAELSSKNDQLTQLNGDMQNLLESTQIATIFLDDELRIKSFTPAATDIFHLRDHDRGRPITDIAARLDYQDLRDDVAKVMLQQSLLERELRTSGDDAAFIMRIRPYRRMDQVIDGVVITFVNITERTRAELMLREHAAMIDFSPDALLGLGLDGAVRSWNPAAERLFGYKAADAVGRSVSFLAAADRHPEQMDLIARARSGNVAGPIETVRRRRDGSDVNVELTVMPILDSRGTVVSIAASARDISERTHAEIHRLLLQHELSHRVKNALATVQSIAQQTLRQSLGIEAFQETFVARLMALSHTHDLLMRSEWQDAALYDVIEAELAPYQSNGQLPWTAVGQNVRLDSKAALAIGMAVHELATNASKYGALSVPGGRIEMSWEKRGAGDEQRLHFRWVESGGPAVVEPPHKGFGTRLIAEGLAFELDGDVQLDFDPAGIRCTIDIPLPRLEGAE